MDQFEPVAGENTAVSSLEDAFRILEACLFAAGHPLTYAKLAETLGVSTASCRELIEKWKPLYNSDEPLPRGILLVTFPDSVQLCTKEAYADFIKTALGIRRGGKLSQSLLEVLAVIAYNQPATRSFVDTVRGVDSSYAVGSLLEKELITPCGKLDAPGHPTLYKTTNKFLCTFGLESLRDLPAVQIRNENGEKVEISPDISFAEKNPAADGQPNDGSSVFTDAHTTDNVSLPDEELEEAPLDTGFPTEESADATPTLEFSAEAAGEAIFPTE